MNVNDKVDESNCKYFPVALLSGNHLQYIRAFPFEHDLPQDFHEELRKAANWVTLDPPNNFQTLTTNGDNIFKSIAKQISEQPKGEMSACLHLQ